MIELDCFVEMMRNDFEIGETDDPCVWYFKHVRPLSESLQIITAHADHKGLDFDLLAWKYDPHGNVAKVRFYEA
jgi:hypothetical protein